MPGKLNPPCRARTPRPVTKSTASRSAGVLAGLDCPHCRLVGGIFGHPRVLSRRGRRRSGTLSAALISFPVCLRLLAQTDQALADSSAAGVGLAAYAQRNFVAAQAHYREAPGEATAAWKFARACFDVADLATNNTERAFMAEQGIAAGQQALARESNSAPAHYYLGMNLGQLARTKGLTALSLVLQMQREFSRAHDLEEQLDWAGPDRNLGLLYRDAPAIASIGSRTKAREHLTRAVELAPQYPENRLNLIEAYLQWGEPNNARRELAALEAAWPSARTNFVGEAWAASWADWEPRLKKLKQKVEAPKKSLGTPRTQP